MMDMTQKMLRKLLYKGFRCASRASQAFRSKKDAPGWEKKDVQVHIPSGVKGKVILGVSSYFHDSSAALLVDGKLVAAAEEERFSRVKHDSGFPVHAIKFCLEQAGLSPKDVDAVAYFEQPEEKLKRVLGMFLEGMPPSDEFQKIVSEWLERKLSPRIEEMLRKMGIDSDVVFVDHHLSHAASSYLMSGFEDAAILTIDGVGEKSTTTLGHGKGGTVALDRCINFPHSIGLLYSAITGYLGFDVNDAEYKVMGLASYGNPQRYLPLMRKLLMQAEDGSFALDARYFSFTSEERMHTDELEKLFGMPVRKKESAVTKEHMDIAAALQAITEEAVLRILRHLHEITGSENLCIAGGVALNSVLNGKILSKTPFKRLFIQPAAGDGGTSLGAAKWLYHTLNPSAKPEKMLHSSHGPSVTDEQIEEFLKKKGIKYKKFESDEEMLSETARLIHQNYVVGWFQGRMEWGPRALGNRSILANPCSPEMRDILNAKVKHREMFRPFAPVVCAEDAAEYFEIDEPLPVPADYMLMVYPVKEEKREKLPAVTHVDGSGRLQTIRREQNPLYYDLIREFGKLSGERMLVNTSFNVRGEPIVCTPEDAFNCVMNTEIDYLVMGHFLIRRADNL